jgi:hypothetical protein
LTFDPTDTDATITVPPAHNNAAGGRVVRLYVESVSGTHTVEETYVLRAANRLEFLKNSFMTYTRAQVLATEIPRLDSWNMAAKEDREAALIEAFTRITRLGFRVKWPEDIEIQGYLMSHFWDRQIIKPENWPHVTTEIFGAWPEAFSRGLQKAQIVEADQLLQGDVVGSKRRLGVMSESIGESSMMFRPGKPLDLGLSRQALEYLTGYLDLRMTLTRT